MSIRFEGGPKNRADEAQFRLDRLAVFLVVYAVFGFGLVLLFVSFLFIFLASSGAFPQELLRLLDPILRLLETRGLVGFYMACLALSLALELLASICCLAAARLVRQRRGLKSLNYCLIPLVARVPFGLALGAYAAILLNKKEVKACFDAPPLQPTNEPWQMPRL